MVSTGMLLREDTLTLPFGSPLIAPGGSGNCLALQRQQGLQISYSDGELTLKVKTQAPNRLKDYNFADYIVPRLKSLL